MNRAPERGRTAPPADRYRRGERRTSAEPLAAAWEPDGTQAMRRPPKRRGVKKLVANYGWRIYAIPVLLVLTALVVLDTVQPKAPATGDGGSTNAAETPVSTPEPPASELPAKKPDLKIPTAELPAGPDFSQDGVGTFKVIAGSGPRIGEAGAPKFRKYAIAVEDGVKPADFNDDPAAFARTIDGILSDPRSWIGTKQVALQRVEANQNPDFVVALTTTKTTHTLCGKEIPFETSCWNPSTKRVIINVARWVRGAMVYGPDLAGYRTYVINHEVGHALGSGHAACAENGAPAPVMMQQTFGVSNDFVSQLNAGQDVVPADGKVCTPNAFPAG
ncbi:DUF3152 domain-containing protein [Lentzea flaviverrucosa]|uniref:DUF3152 domain-containing protein n=1 Tax=Lentzea flaviverrucosa TaxID=200379 RepID=A0A1H9MW00_9PSEU|nr:DUF3152 domain-containing protein [Lentzea flaviverrucosa]RDI30757.1 uncharacterized protein DUF3152 [Lentzea flaviverrucosa]SER27874.1 Protein of unknown function [Lentzea flaviverrucosa]